MCIRLCLLRLATYTGLVCMDSCLHHPGTSTDTHIHESGLSTHLFIPGMCKPRLGESGVLPFLACFGFIPSCLHAKHNH